jgi:hypothetical protein
MLLNSALNLFRRTGSTPGNDLDNLTDMKLRS